MRLINTSTLQLEEHFSSYNTQHDDDKLEYAILSHTWGSEEVTLQEFRDSTSRSKRGWRKINEFCAKAAQDGFSHAWIDTCCIDKTSSAELSEAINSMFTWYKDAKRCYVYLEDVSSHSCAIPNAYLKSSIDHDMLDGVDVAKNHVELFDTTVSDFSPGFPPIGQIRKSRWFRRGWTLQELLAPIDVAFYDSAWNFLGDKQELRQTLQEITGIQDIKEYWHASTAQKFSWAAKRETTRIEDAAYSLLGLFEINMPLLYGEGSRAFVRLQMFILDRSEDESIFAWGPSEQQKDELGTLSGLLAPFLPNFVGCGDIEPYFHDTQRPSWAMTNQGFQFSAQVYPAMDFRTSIDNRWGDAMFVIPLNCRRGTGGAPLAITVQKVTEWPRHFRKNVGAERYQRYISRPRDWLPLLYQQEVRERSTLLFPQHRRTGTWYPAKQRYHVPKDSLLFVRIHDTSLALHGFTSQQLHREQKISQSRKMDRGERMPGSEMGMIESAADINMLQSSTYDLDGAVHIGGIHNDDLDEYTCIMSTTSVELRLEHYDFTPEYQDVSQINIDRTTSSGVGTGGTTYRISTNVDPDAYELIDQRLSSMTELIFRKPNGIVLSVEIKIGTSDTFGRYHEVNVKAEPVESAVGRIGQNQHELASMRLREWNAKSLVREDDDEKASESASERASSSENDKEEEPAAEEGHSGLWSQYRRSQPP